MPWLRLKNSNWSASSSTVERARGSYLSLHREICYNRKWERVSRNDAGGEEGFFPFVTICPPYFWKGRHILWRIKIRNKRKSEKRRPSRTSKKSRQPAKRRRQRRARLLLYRGASARTRSTEALADKGAWGQKKRYATFVLRLLSVPEMLTAVRTHAPF